MKGFRLNLLGVWAILAAYLATGILSPKSLHGQEFFLKPNNSLSVRNEQSIGLDERPFWTSHKHLTSSENSPGDHILRTAEPWSSVTASERFVTIQALFFPIPIPLFPANALRAPPLS